MQDDLFILKGDDNKEYKSLCNETYPSFRALNKFKDEKIDNKVINNIEVTILEPNSDIETDKPSLC